MKLGLSERQYKLVISEVVKSQEIEEQGEPVNPEPEAGTSSQQSGGKGYPAVGKWESGVTRGPANQIGVTKWSDVVGASLKRGKANQLKEQSDYLMDKRGNALANAVGVRSDKDYNQVNKIIDDAQKSNGELVRWIAKETNWDAWGQWALMGGSILAACFIPGAQGLWISIGLDVIAAADLYFNKKDNFGAGIAGILAFVPIIGKSLKIGTVSVEMAEKLAKYLAPLKTEEQVLSAISKLSKQEQYIVQQVLKQDPNTLNNLIKSITASKIATKQEALRVATQINDLLKSGKLPKASAAAFYKNLNLKRFGFDLAISGAVIIAGEGLRYYFNKKSRNAVIQGMTPPPSDVEIAQLAEKVDKMNRSDFENKIVPIFEKYGKLYDGLDEGKLNRLRKIQKSVLLAYIKNSKSDLNVVATNADKN
jgi:hypothetical protein